MGPKQFVVALAVTALLWGVTSPGAAQAVVDLELSAALAEDPELQSEWSSIETESDWATALYVGGVITHVLGLGSLGTGVVFALGDTSVATGFAFAGIVGASLGLISIGVAIGLDVDSGSRRRALLGRVDRATLRLRLGPATLGLEGTF